MSRIFHFASCMVVFLLTSCQEEEHTLSLLVFTKTTMYRHASIESGINALTELAKDHNAEIEFTENSEMFSSVSLKKYDVVIFLNTTGDVLNDEQQLQMMQWVKSGGGFVGIHSATDTEYDWTWYGELVGAYFNGHPDVQSARLVVDNNHVSTQHLPDEWIVTDEWYNFKDIQSEIHVLMNLDETTYQGGTNGEHHPITWYREFDGGRMWYTGMGHTQEFFQDEKSIQMLWGGIVYAGGKK